MAGEKLTPSSERDNPTGNQIPIETPHFLLDTEPHETYVLLGDYRIGKQFTGRGNVVNVHELIGSGSTLSSSDGGFERMYVRGESETEGDVIVMIENTGQVTYASSYQRAGEGGSEMGKAIYPKEVINDMSLTIGEAYPLGPIDTITEVVAMRLRPGGVDQLPTSKILPTSTIVEEFEDMCTPGYDEIMEDSQQRAVHIELKGNRVTQEMIEGLDRIRTSMPEMPKGYDSTEDIRIAREARSAQLGETSMLQTLEERTKREEEFPHYIAGFAPRTEEEYETEQQRYLGLTDAELEAKVSWDLNEGTGTPSLEQEEHERMVQELANVFKALRGEIPSRYELEGIIAQRQEDIRELQKDGAVYVEHREEFLADHRGQVVLIRDGEIFGFFDTRDEADIEGRKEFGKVPFFTHTIVPAEEDRITIASIATTEPPRVEGDILPGLIDSIVDRKTSLGFEESEQGEDEASHPESIEDIRLPRLLYRDFEIDDDPEYLEIEAQDKIRDVANARQFQ